MLALVPSGKIGLINKNSDHFFKNFSIELMKKKPKLKFMVQIIKQRWIMYRDFIHVSDIAEIHYLVLEKINKLNTSKILNCGYNKELSVLQVAKEFKRQSSKKNLKLNYLKDEKGDLIKIIAIIIN